MIHLSMAEREDVYFASNKDETSTIMHKSCPLKQSLYVLQCDAYANKCMLSATASSSEVAANDCSNHYLLTHNLMIVITYSFLPFQNSLFHISMIGLQFDCRRSSLYIHIIVFTFTYTAAHYGTLKDYWSRIWPNRH